MRSVRRFFGGLTRLLDTVLLGLFALAYAALYLRPSSLTWSLQMLAIGLPFLSLGVAVAACVAFATGRRRVVHAVALAMVLARFGVPLGGGKAQPDDLSIVTYNLPRYWGGVPDTVRARAVEAFAREAAPVLMAFQEAGSMALDSVIAFNPHIARVQHRLGFEMPVARGPSYAHNTTLMRLTPDRVENVRLTLVPGQTYTELQRVYFSWQGRGAVLYNIHLRSYGRSKPWQDGLGALFRPGTWAPFVAQYRDAVLYRALEADTIRAMLDRETVPALVAGDFNGNAHTWAYHRIRGERTDTFRRAGREWGATYHIRLPVARIDFILADPEWEVVAASVPDVRLSDHRPVAATLRWRDPPADAPPTPVRAILPPDSAAARPLRTLDMVERRR